MSIPTAFSTFCRSIFSPTPREPLLSGIGMMAGYACDLNSSIVSAQAEKSFSVTNTVTYPSLARRWSVRTEQADHVGVGQDDTVMLASAL